MHHSDQRNFKIKAINWTFFSVFNGPDLCCCLWRQLPFELWGQVLGQGLGEALPSDAVVRPGGDHPQHPPVHLQHRHTQGRPSKFIHQDVTGTKPQGQTSTHTLPMRKTIHLEFRSDSVSLTSSELKSFQHSSDKWRGWAAASDARSNLAFKNDCGGTLTGHFIRYPCLIAC